MTIPSNPTVQYGLWLPKVDGQRNGREAGQRLMTATAEQVAAFSAKIDAGKAEATQMLQTSNICQQAIGAFHLAYYAEVEIWVARAAASVAGGEVQTCRPELTDEPWSTKRTWDYTQDPRAMGTAAAESFIASAIRGSQPEIRRNLPAAIAKAKDAVALQAQSTDLAERVGAAWWTEYFDAMENCQVSFSQRVAV